MLPLFHELSYEESAGLFTQEQHANIRQNQLPREISSRVEIPIRYLPVSMSNGLVLALSLDPCPKNTSFSLRTAAREKSPIFFGGERRLYTG